MSKAEKKTTASRQAAPKADPIIAAIAAHKAASGKKAWRAESAAAHRMRDTAPTTAEGRKAYLEYLQSEAGYVAFGMDEHGDWKGVVKTLLEAAGPKSERAAKLAKRRA